jgi:DNA gyrase subunit B
VREGNQESVHYFSTQEELRQFSEANPDLKIFGEQPAENGAQEKEKKTGPTRRARHEELYESKAAAELLKKIENKGLNVEHYSAQDMPLFEMIEGEGEKAIVKPLFSIAEILTSVKEAGRKGIQIKRFKGLGEMNAKELFETTMNPEHRKLLRIDLTDAVEAEEMFTRLMGDEVEPRRQFIEDNALNVRNLDV